MPAVLLSVLQHLLVHGPVRRMRMIAEDMLSQRCTACIAFFGELPWCDGVMASAAAGARQH
jgi:hypothetical protein